MIRLQFVLGSGWSSRLIAWYGQGFGGWSHVDAVLPDGRLLGARSDTVGGQPPGVRIRPANYERWKRRTLVEIPCTSAEETGWVGWLRQQVGYEYDKAAIIGFILGRPAHTPHHWICSACQRGALEAVGKLHPCDLIPDSETTPDALFQVVTEGIGGIVVEDVHG